MSTDSETKSPPHPFARLCHVIKSDTFDGYGFNLHAEKGKPGQYIGKVDEGSPAEFAGLRQGDRILEVNGVSIINETHKQVVQRIKALPNETKLYVVDPDDEHLNSSNSHDENNGSTNNLTAAAAATTDNNSNASSKSISETTTASANNGQAHGGNNAHAPAHAHVHAEETEDNTNANGNSKQDFLNLSMTAAELRAKLAAKKKFDPRKEQIDFKKKFDTVQKL